MMLAGLYDQLVQILPQRPATTVVRSRPEAIEDTYAMVDQALVPTGPSRG